jgi:hypothetical protein
MTVAGALFLFLAGRVSFFALRIPHVFFFQGAKPRSARSFLHRPLLGRWSSSSVKRLRALAVHGPDALLPRTADSLSRPYVLAVSGFAPLSLVAPGPDVDAFTGGVVTALSAGFIVLVALGGLAIVRRILGS